MTSPRETASSFRRSARSSSTPIDQQTSRQARNVWRAIRCIAVMLLSLPAPLAADLDGYYCQQEFDCEKLVRRFLDVFRSGDRTQIVRLVHYPLRRAYPLPSIVNPEQMLERYDEVFDESVTAWISESELTEWSDVGWRGIMLGRGVMWLDYDGLLHALSYTSERGQAEWDRLLQRERAGLHRSLREDHVPILEWITEHYRVRIDDTQRAENVVWKRDESKPFDGTQPSLGGYRYAAWYADKTHDQEPDLILYGGQPILDGSGGNHRYLFTNGDYRYEVSVNVLGNDRTPIGSLTVFRVDELGTDSLYVERKEVKGSRLLDEPVVAVYRPVSNTDTTVGGGD